MDESKEYLKREPKCTECGAGSFLYDFINNNKGKEDNHSKVEDIRIHIHMSMDSIMQLQAVHRRGHLKTG